MNVNILSAYESVGKWKEQIQDLASIKKVDEKKNVLSRVMRIAFKYAVGYRNGKRKFSCKSNQFLLCCYDLTTLYIYLR